MGVRYFYSNWHHGCLIKNMMHKNAITIHKPWPHMISFGLHLHEIVAKLQKTISIQVPTGYQDETGFHMGVKPADKEIKWPSVW
jgi:hypothetical protein